MEIESPTVPARDATSSQTRMHASEAPNALYIALMDNPLLSSTSYVSRETLGFMAYQSGLNDRASIAGRTNPDAF